MRQCTETGSAGCFALSSRHASELCPPPRCGPAVSPACSAARSAPHSQSQPRLPAVRISPMWTPWLRRRRGRQPPVGLPSRRSRLPAAVDRAHPSVAPEAPMRQTNDSCPHAMPTHASAHGCVHPRARIHSRTPAHMAIPRRKRDAPLTDRAARPRGDRRGLCECVHTRLCVHACERSWVRACASVHARARVCGFLSV